MYIYAYTVEATVEAEHKCFPPQTFSMSSFHLVHGTTANPTSFWAKCSTHNAVKYQTVLHFTVLHILIFYSVVIGFIGVGPVDVDLLLLF